MKQIKITATCDNFTIVGLYNEPKRFGLSPSSDVISNEIKGLYRCLEMLHAMPPAWYIVFTSSPDPMFMIASEYVPAFIDHEAQTKLSDIIQNKKKHLKYLDI